MQLNPVLLVSAFFQPGNALVAPYESATYLICKCRSTPPILLLFRGPSTDACSAVHVHRHDKANMAVGAALVVSTYSGFLLQVLHMFRKLALLKTRHSQ